MIGCPSRVELRLYLDADDSLGQERSEWIEAHVGTCQPCQSTLDGLIADEVPSGPTLPDLGPHGYRVYRLLGAGTFGEVWLAQDLNLPRVVAVKTLKPGVDLSGRSQALDALRHDAGLLTKAEIARG